MPMIKLVWFVFAFIMRVNASLPTGDLSKPIRSEPTNDCFKYNQDVIITETRRTINKKEQYEIFDTLGKLRGGSMLAGWHPSGYGITELGLEYISFDGSLDSDVGRFLASFKSGRKRFSVLKDQWLEIVRISKTGQSMRVYRKLEALLNFCVKAGFLN